MSFQKWIPAAALLAALLSGCNATKARINDNEELFNSYPPDVQAMIRSNRIDEGFDTTQVYLACGNADRTELRDDQEVWYYHETLTDTVREEKSAAEYRDELIDYGKAVEKGYRNVEEPKTYRMVRLHRTRVARIVYFQEGQVISWEEPEEMWLDEWHR